MRAPTLPPSFPVGATNCSKRLCSASPWAQNTRNNRDDTRGRWRRSRHGSRVPGRACRGLPSRTLSRAVCIPCKRCAACIRLAAMQECADHFHQLLLVDGTATQLEIYAHMLSNGRGFPKCLDVGGGGIDDGYEFLDVLKVP